jgi:hypothetical protein
VASSTQSVLQEQSSYSDILPQESLHEKREGFTQTKADKVLSRQDHEALSALKPIGHIFTHLPLDLKFPGLQEIQA